MYYTVFIDFFYQSKIIGIIQSIMNPSLSHTHIHTCESCRVLMFAYINTHLDSLIWSNYLSLSLSLSLSYTHTHSQNENKEFYFVEKKGHAYEGKEEKAETFFGQKQYGCKHYHSKKAQAAPEDHSRLQWTGSRNLVSKDCKLHSLTTS